MANEKKTSRKKFRVAVSGSTVDGREISPVHLREAAENFNPDVYAGQENARNEAQASTLKSTVDTLNIISAGVQDMQQVLAQLRVENQQRNQDGEARREQLRNDIAKDECAHALPDARFTDRLRRHAERATASAVSPAYTADADHTGNASPLP